jgi:hypothetical protein
VSRIAALPLGDRLLRIQAAGFYVDHGDHHRHQAGLRRERRRWAMFPASATVNSGNSVWAYSLDWTTVASP